MKIGIKAIEYYLPEKVLTNEELAKIYLDWSAEKIYEKTERTQNVVLKLD